MSARTLRQIFAAPTAVAGASAVGLLAALMGDGWWDTISWITLGLVAVLSAWFALPWRKGSAHRR